jgi:hypothetical protein
VNHMGNNTSTAAGVQKAPASPRVLNQITVDPSFSIDAIRGLLSDPSIDVIVFGPGTYDLSGSFPSDHVFTINRSVTLKALQQESKPALNIINSGFDPQTDNTRAGAIIVNAPGQRVEFENLIINTNRSLDVTASDYLRIDGCDITTTGGPANSAVYLGDYVSEQNEITGDVVIENCSLVAEPGGHTTRTADGTLIRENFNAGIFAHFARANYRIRNNYLSGNAGVECYGANNTLVELNTVLARDYINSWVSFGIVVTNNPGTSVTIRDNKITLALPEPVEDPFGLTSSFGPANGIGVQHGVAIQAGQLIFDLPAYDVTVMNNEVTGNASFMIWFYRVTNGRIENNRRNNLKLPWFDYNAERNPPLVPFNTTLFGMPALPPYPAAFVGMDFAEYGLMGMLLGLEGWWRSFALGYAPASEYCLLYSTDVHLLDNETPVARFLDFNGTLDSSTFQVAEIPSTNKVLVTLRRVVNAKPAMGKPNEASIPLSLRKTMNPH